MAHKIKAQHNDNPSEEIVGPQKEPTSVKVTLHLKVQTAQRLGIESAMRRISQSAIAEEVLAEYLSRWEIPTLPGPTQREAA